MSLTSAMSRRNQEKNLISGCTRGTEEGQLSPFLKEITTTLNHLLSMGNSP